MNKDPLRVRSFAVRALVGLSRASLNPSTAPELVRKLISRKILDLRHKRRLRDYDEYTVSFEEAISKATQVNISKIKEVVAEKGLECTVVEVKRRAAELGIRYLAGGGFVQLCYVLCRLLKPTIAIETGVAYGWTTVFVLSALRKNGKGSLHSIDRPAFSFGSQSWIASMVPESLKDRWLMYVGA